MTPRGSVDGGEGARRTLPAVRVPVCRWARSRRHLTPAGRTDRWLLAAVVVVAILARIVPVLRSGGFGGDYGYDATVYYAAAAAIAHGELPYRDFLTLHPPGVPLLLTPFALLGRLTSDHVGFTAANLAVTGLSALNCVLVHAVARVLGLARWAALAGAAFYALWFRSIAAEYLTRLEPFGNFFFLGGLLALAVAVRRDSRGHLLAAGAAFAMAVTCKLWWVLPIGVVLVARVVADRSLKRLAAIAAGSLATALVAVVPIVIAAPGQFASMVL